MVRIFKSNLFFFILLFLVVFVVYGKSINFGITNLDDDTFILREAQLLSNFKNIPHFFLKDCYFGTKTPYYRPILTISFSIEHFLFKKNLKIFHLTNILLYIFSLFIIYIFLSKLNFNKLILKFFVLLFAVHPILSSIPVWIPARNDTLLTIFFLLSMISFIDYIKTDKTKYLLLFFSFFFLSLFVKETTVLLIFVYPLLIYNFNLKTKKKQLIKISSFIFLLLIIYFILRYYAVHSINTFFYFNNFFYYIKNIVIGTMLYIEKTFYPANIPIILYDLKLTLHLCIINFFIVILLLFIYYKQVIYRKIFIFAFIFSFLAILPTFLQEEYTFLTHRFIISLPGILIILSIISETLISKFSKTKKYLFIIFIFSFLLFSFCSFLQIEKYKDSFTYWNNAYIDSPNHHSIYSQLAKEYEKKELFNEAIELSLKAVELKKSFDNCLTYAIILFKNKDYALSKDIFFQLLSIKENNFLIYKHLSNIFLIEKNFAKAIEFAKKALEKANIIDDKILMLENLAKVYAVSEKYYDSIKTLFDLINYKEKGGYYYNISLLYEDLNDYINSIIYIKKALEIEPNNEDYVNQLKNIENKLSAK